MRIGWLLACAGLAASCAPPPKQPPALMAPGVLETLPADAADFRIRYGNEPSQFGELRVPAGNGPHPVVVLIHGGCWKAQYASLRDLAAMADAFKAAGIASWNIEYLRLGEPGGGWPGTYRDAAAGVDHLRVLAQAHDLDLSRVVVLGHSAGGHLAHWSAARGRLSAKSELYNPNPLPLSGIINLAGRMDMADGIDAYENMCRDRVVRGLLGGDPRTMPQRYHDSSPMALLPLGVPQVMIWGDHEDFVPEPLVRSYVAVAKRAGDPVELIIVPNAGHFETASPNSSAWPVVLGAVQRLFATAASARR